VTDRQAGTAFVWAWLVLSGMALLVLLAPLVLPEEALLATSRGLRSHHPGGEPCGLCGLTRAFLAISRGSWQEAIAFNRGSVTLFAILLANGCAAVAYVALHIRNWLPFGSSGGPTQREMHLSRRRKSHAGA